MAVTDGMVVWVGSDQVGRSLHPDAEVVDLDGRFVAPAFIDAHVHLTALGLSLASGSGPDATDRDLAHATGRSDFLSRLGALVAASPAGGVVVAGGWDESNWAAAPVRDDHRLPSQAELDAVADGRAVYLPRVDEHSALASSALRTAAGADLNTAAGAGTDVLLTGAAHHRVRAAAWAGLGVDRRRDAQQRALDHCLANGIVGVHENGGPDISGAADFAALGDLDHPALVRRYWGEAVGDAAAARELLAATGADGLAGDVFIDGSLGSRTALLSQPYADAATSGSRHLDPEAVFAHLAACTEIGVQAGFHVIGDAAMSLLTDAVDRLADRVGTAAVARCAHRVEHAEMVTAAQAQSLARCGFVAVMQPGFTTAFGGPDGLYERRLGSRARSLNDFALLAKAGVGLAFSSDAPVTEVSPWAAVSAAANHPDSTNSISPRAAFAASTRGGWRAAGVNDGVTGMLVPSAPAHYAVWEVEDFVVAGSDESVQRWSTDPRSRVPALPDVAPGAALPRCVQTVVAGVPVYTAEQP